ncbi:MAG: hypothetical protein NC033_02205 [Clostridiales bacterium]|nr:hypothetical protein [Clostridiales bacterium]
MQVIDWVAIGVVLGAIAIGTLLGFGKQLKIFTGGIIGVLISLVVTYFSIGVVASWGFVQDIMLKLHNAMAGADNAFVNFLIKIGIEKIILGIALFIIIQIIRVIIVNIIKGVMEADNVVLKTINRVAGAVFMLAVACMVTLIVFHIIQLIGGNTAGNFHQSISGSVFKLDWVYENNPLRFIVQKIGESVNI